MHSALSQKHLNISFVWLRVKVVDKKDCEVNFFSNYHSSYFGVSSHWARVHTFDIINFDAVILEGFLDEASGSTGANEVVLSEEMDVMNCPFNHISFSVVVRYERDCQFFVHNQ
jgi:hypothetical protein